MSDMLTIGASGLRAYQTALSTTSDNIANAGTAGFSRRTATIEEIAKANRVGLGQTTNLVGNGAFASGIARSEDSFRAADVRRTSADLARTETGVVWLDRIEGALGGNKLDERMTAFFNAAKGVAADPAATAPRAVMLETASSLAAAFAGTGNALAGAASDLAGTGRDAADQISGLSDSLLKVNNGLARADTASAGRAQLLDERDRLLEAMSAITDVSVSTDSIGRATVRAGGTAGPILTDVGSAATVTFVMNDSGAASIAVHRNGFTQSLNASGGAFAGIVDAAGRIASARETVDTMAKAFVAGVNGVQATGVDLNGTTPGAAIFADNSNDPNPTALKVVMNDPKGIAAAAAATLTTPAEGARGNGNIAKLAELRSTGGYEATLDDLTTANAAALQARSSVASAQGSIRDAAVAARDSVTGVDLDEEAVDLIRFQQAYQASSRVIQVARDTLNAIFEIF